MFRPAHFRFRRGISALAVALLALQAAAPTAEILHEIRHVREAWESIPTASAALESAARGGCDDERPDRDRHEDGDDGTCDLCGSFAPLRIFSDAEAGSAYVTADRTETVAPATFTPPVHWVVTDGDPRGPPSPTA